jgi:hypothetical protein
MRRGDPVSDFTSAAFTATVDQLAAIIRDALDKMGTPITNTDTQKVLGFTAHLLLNMDKDPSPEILATHAAIQTALGAVR